jgi:hypothetical protein
VLERVAFLQLAVGGDDGLEPGRELAPFRRERGGGGLEAEGDRLERRGGLGGGGDALGQEPGQRVLPGHEHLPLVREVPEEGALGQPGPVGDLGDGGDVVALLGEPVERGGD